MKMGCRQVVPGTERPPIHIGRRSWRDKHGRERISRYWSAEWFMHGKQCFQSLKTGNKQAAIKAAHALHRSLCLGEPTRAAPEVRVADLMERYLVTKRGEGRTPKTLAKYEKVLNDFAGHCEAQGVLYGSRIGSEDFWSFEAERTLSDKTRYDRRVIILQATKWATQEAELLRENPLRHIKMTKPEWAEQPCFTREQVATMLQTAPAGLRDVLLFLACTGCRVGEMRDTEWGDINLGEGSHGFLTVRRGGSDGKTKSKRSRRLPLHPELATMLRARPRKQDRVFSARDIGGRSDGPIDAGVLLKQVKRLCTTSGFEKPDQFKTHSFRHYFASMLARNNVSYKYALTFMGHQSSDILDLYYRMYDQDAERAILAVEIGQSPKSAA